jgi:triosephosphate isomerase (TIM)
MRRPLIAGNWKMHKTHLEAMRLVQEMGHELADLDPRAVEVVVCPPFTSLRTVQTLIDADRYEFGLGAQNVFSESGGAYTGEISAGMLRALDVSYVIVGHSERRQLLSETDEQVSAKVQVLVRHALTPILCCGETGDERAEGEAEAVVERQVQVAFRGMKADQVRSAVVAYEPIWAIGTGQTATPDDAQETIAYVRSVLASSFGEEVAEEMRIIYGGSVKSGNAAALMGGADVDGFLVGGASLDAGEFSAIVKAST